MNESQRPSPREAAIAVVASVIVGVTVYTFCILFVQTAWNDVAVKVSNGGVTPVSFGQAVTTTTALMWVVACGTMFGLGVLSFGVHLIDFFVDRMTGTKE